MFRTVAVRGNFLKANARKVIKHDFVRALVSEGARKGSIGQTKTFLSPTNKLKWSHNFVRCYSSDFPPHIKVVLPALSPTMEEGTLVSWAKKEGDKLTEGDLLAEIETDKATMAFETPEEGYLAKILIPGGTKGVPIGKLVCVIVENESDVAAFKNFKDDSTPGKKAAKSAAATAPAPAPVSIPTPAAPAPSMPTQPSPPPIAPGKDRVYASPMAKTLAEKRNIRLHGKGTGLFDSITSKDLDGLAAQTPEAAIAKVVATTVGIPKGATPDYIDIPISNIRDVIAKRLLHSKQSIPHYYLSCELNVDRVLELRAKFNKKLEKDKMKLSINDFIIKASALSCIQVPDTNSAWLDTAVRRYKNCDVSVAVATDRGLITPIIFEANNKGIVAISKEVKQLAAKAREGKLQPHEFQGGTFSVSNLGMFGVNKFCAIINPPQSGILAIGMTTSKLVPDDTSEKGFKTSNFVWVTLSADHRLVDGAIGAQWLQVFRNYMEDPDTMLL